MDILSSIHHQETAASCVAERAFLRGVEGGCQIPVGVYSQVDNELLTLHAIVLNLSGSEAVSGKITGNIKEAAELGSRLAVQIKEQGGEKILKEVLETVERETKVK